MPLPRRLATTTLPAWTRPWWRSAALSPSGPSWSRSRAVTKVSELAPLLARLHLSGDTAIFGSGSEQDPDNSDAMIVGLTQDGLGLPDRDYYTKDDPKSKEIRQRYVEHVQKMFELIGDSPDQARQEAAHGDAHRDRPGQGVANPRRAARSLQGHAQDESGGA